MIKLNAKELRISNPTEEELVQIKRNPITIIIDNVLDTYNIGAIFRVADSIAAEKIYLCGKTETPPYHKIQKASVGTWQWVPWQYVKTAVSAIAKVKSQKSPASPSEAGRAKIKIIAIEQHPKSVAYTQIKYEFPIAFVIGHETEGISKEVLSLADHIVEIPMYGVNKSLNVMVSLAIVSYFSLSSI
ncbi:hypothetical protein HYT02_00830 [Candidatus Gottesmanbacteria bacterium]|nr:hypothetical protein [Candidatus Gottesmanbacteria bacterium]